MSRPRRVGASGRRSRPSTTTGRRSLRSRPPSRAGTGPLVEADLGCPVPEPRQVFAIGLNYRSHAEESGMALPAVPATFTKFPASLGGPFDDIEIVGIERRLGGRARRRHRPRAPTGWRRPTPGPTSPASPSARTSATAALQFAAGVPVLPRQVTPRLRPDGAVGRHPRRGARPRRSRPRLLGRRRGRAGRSHQRPRVRRTPPRRRALVRPAAPARRRDLHRHSRGRGLHPLARPVAPTRQRARDVDRGHRHDQEPCV